MTLLQKKLFITTRHGTLMNSERIYRSEIGGVMKLLVLIFIVQLGLVWPQQQCVVLLVIDPHLPEQQVYASE